MSEIVMLGVDKLWPHPENPRKDLGDLTELAASIKAKGVLQNLTVVPKAESGMFTVIIGHRRHAAAKLAGIREVPCVVADMTPEEQVETMLLENMQRSDLTPYEQAKGFQMMMDMGRTVEDIVQKSGFSESTVRHRLKLAQLDEKKFKASAERALPSRTIWSWRRWTTWPSAMNFSSTSGRRTTVPGSKGRWTTRNRPSGWLRSTRLTPSSPGR